MQREIVFELIQKYVKTALPELINKKIEFNDTFSNLGVNSLLRVDVISQVKEDLSIEVSQIELMGISSLGELASVLANKVATAPVIE